MGGGGEDMPSVSKMISLSLLFLISVFCLIFSILEKCQGIIDKPAVWGHCKENQQN